MAVINNYGELKSAVARYLDRSDGTMTVNVPMFISFAESDLYQILDIPQDEGAATISVPTAGAGIAIPDECETIKALMVNGEVATRVQIETLSKLPQDGIKPTVWEQLERKQYYSKFRNEFIFLPELKANDEVTLYYTKHHNEMVADSDAPKCLPECGALLVYLALRHAAVFLRDNEQEQYWAQKAEEIAQRLQERYRKAQQDGSVPYIQS